LPGERHWRRHAWLVALGYTLCYPHVEVSIKNCAHVQRAQYSTRLRRFCFGARCWLRVCPSVRSPVRGLGVSDRLFPVPNGCASVAGEHPANSIVCGSDCGFRPGLMFGFRSMHGVTAISRAVGNQRSNVSVANKVSASIEVSDAHNKAQRSELV
jgi:hypothetical protein